MKLICATTNNAKLFFMRRILKTTGIEICGLNDLDIPQSMLPLVEENGNDPLENAKMKAIAYYNAIKRPLFSCDSGLYIDGLSQNLQPGVNVRTVNGKRLTDDEMIAYYSGLAREMGGSMTARYVNGICLVLSDEEIYSHTGDDISYDRFLITDRPHSKQRVEGFPLDCLSVRIETGKYYYDSEDDFEQERESDVGVINFFKKVLNI